MKRIVFGLLFAVLACCTATAQTTVRIQAQAVAVCGAQALTAGVFYPATQDLTGTLCSTGGGGGGGGAVTIANGADVTQGALADAAVTAGATGSLSAKLRSISRDVMTVNTWAGGTLGAMATYGTSPGAVLVPSVNAFVTNTTALGQAALAGSSPVAIAKNSGTGSTVAGAAVGTAGTASAEVVTVQGISGGTPVPVSATPLTLAGGATWVKGTTAAMTGVTSTQLIASVASNRIYAMRVSCKGDPANAVGTKVLIQDGSGGTALDTLSVAANGGGEQATGSTPLFWTTSGNGLFAQNVTTSASVICTASGYSGG